MDGVIERVPQREVHHGEGVAWLRAATLDRTHAIVTSLPDVSEVPALDLPTWCQWFVDTTALICTRVADDALAIFYQTDIKHDGRWIDKAHLVARGAEAAGSPCVWHKIVCRTEPGRTTFGRPAYGHWLAYSRAFRMPGARATADVLPDPGAMTWARAMPMNAAVATVRFLREHTACRVIVDPFCGHGTILAVANDHGLDAIGVELSAKRVRKALRLGLSGDGLPDPAKSGP